MSVRRLYRDSVHNAVTAPATAVLAGARRWLRANDEAALLRLVEWDRYHAGTRGRLLLGCALLGLVGFRLLNSIFAVGLYGFGALLIFPLMFVLWILSAFSAVPGIPAMVTFFKGQLDTFLLGSLGEIKVYLEEVTQATKARAELEDAIDALKDRSDEVVIVAHSLGSAISYETLAIPRNHERAQRVRSLLTVGGILPMVWRVRSRRPAFDRPLPSHVRWVNLWSRLDPADPGPISLERLRIAKPDHAPDGTSSHEPADRLSVGALPDPTPGGFADIIVSNEDDLLRDHTSYWDNAHEITPILVREIWGAGASEATGNFQKEEGLRALRRRLQILALSGPRLVAWYILPVSFVALLAQMNASSRLLSFTPRDADAIGRVLEMWGLSGLADWPVFKMFMTQPYSLGECLLIALTGAAIAGVLAQMLYGFMRSVLWNGFFKDLQVFSPTVPVGDREERVVRMEDGQAGEIIGISVGRGFRI